MQLLKFKLFWVLLIFSLKLYAVNISSLKCINLQFETSIKRKVLFGMSENILLLKKNACIVSIHYSRYKYFSDDWLIDICREPIHIKKGKISFDIYKRGNGCRNNKSDFCKEWSKISTIIQDEGLIFASGDRENLSEQHGQVYCTFNVLRNYLQEGILLNKHKQVSLHFLNHQMDNAKQNSFKQTNQVSTIKDNSLKNDVVDDRDNNNNINSKLNSNVETKEVNSPFDKSSPQEKILKTFQGTF